MMAKTEEGLCQSCRNAAGCNFRRDGNLPPTECEEFELAGMGVGRQTGAARPVARRAASAAAEPELLGLCQNCRVRSSCLQPKPEGGIWFCEEYDVE